LEVSVVLHVYMVMDWRSGILSVVLGVTILVGCEITILGGERRERLLGSIVRHGA